MKKLIIIGSALMAFSAVNLIANNNTGNNGYAQAISSANTASLDTVPKKDSTKKKTDSVAFQIKEKN